MSVFANSKNLSSSVLPEFYESPDLETVLNESDHLKNESLLETKTISSEDLAASVFGSYLETPLEPPVKKSEYIEAPRPLPQSYDIPEPEPERFRVDKKETLGIRASTINMPIERAAAAGKSTFGEVKDVILKFIPYWKYTYTLKVDRKVGNDYIKMAASGDGLYNAVNEIGRAHV